MDVHETHMLHCLVLHALGQNALAHVAELLQPCAAGQLQEGSFLHGQVDLGANTDTDT